MSPQVKYKSKDLSSKLQHKYEKYRVCICNHRSVEAEAGESLELVELHIQQETLISKTNMGHLQKFTGGILEITCIQYHQQVGIV